MKFIITLIFAIVGFSAVAQQISYTEWKEKAKTEIRLLPEYDNATKSPEQINVDNEFIKTSLVTDVTPHAASEHMVKVGFDYLYRGDLTTAMYRFNQAWLLDHKNENSYWGFAAVYFSFNDYDEALKQLDKGLLLNPNSSNILTDKATIYIGYYMNKNDVSYLNKAIAMFTRSYTIDTLNQNTLFKLSAAYYYKGDCAHAWMYYNACMKLGGKSISPGYAEALKKQCKL